MAVSDPTEMTEDRDGRPTRGHKSPLEQRRVALVAGAAAELGRAIALALALAVPRATS
jgi:hypothetical protein